MTSHAVATQPAESAPELSYRRLCPRATGGPCIVGRTKLGRDRIVLLTPDTAQALIDHRLR